MQVKLLGSSRGEESLVEQKSMSTCSGTVAWSLGWVAKEKEDDGLEKFQEIGSAYNTIVRHLEQPSHGWADDDDDEGMYHCDDDYYENNMEFLL